MSSADSPSRDSIPPLKHVTIYTDGACLGNPGRGGYGVVLLYDDRRKELSGGFRRTTNNRMELLAVIMGLRALREPCIASVFSDSQYVVKAMQEGWPQRWSRNGWKRGRNENAINPDLWQELLDLCAKHTVDFSWVRGHRGNVENERCDRLATQAANQPDLPPDLGYEPGAVKSLRQ
jgi:ribonuclease HI